MKVLIVDSSSAIISRLTELLSEEAIVSTIYGAITYEEAIVVTKEKNPDVLIIDSTNHDNNSIEMIKEIIATEKRPAIIVLANCNDNQSLELLKLHGVDYIFDKYHEFQKVPVTIRLIAGKLIG